MGSVAHERHDAPCAAHRRADDPRDRRARRRADRRAAAARAGGHRARDARHRARRRRGRAPAPARGRRDGDQRPVRDHPRRPSRYRSQGRGRRREEAAMILWWIGAFALLIVVFPVVVYLLNGVLTAARSIVPSVERVQKAAAAGSKDLDATALLLTTQDQVAQTVAGVAGYGGSLDVIIDDAS